MDSESSDLLAEILSHFNEYQTVFFASIDGDTPRCRPVTLARLADRWWILTGTTDAKVRQLQAASAFELCLPLNRGDDHGYVRASGRAKIVEDPATRGLIAERCAYFKSYWQEAVDPTFTLVELQLEAFELLRPGEKKAFARAAG
jgi:uncharacterized pyridoxamine 5'-phosphate oxidase family protein